VSREALAKWDSLRERKLNLRCKFFRVLVGLQYVKVRLIKIAIAFLVLTIFLIRLPGQVVALYDPLSTPNNRFGIHIVDENDLNDAARLVNSSGGDWGYVKLVIREDDRKREKWQAVFDRMRDLHLIPIVRLATRVERGLWVKPRVEDIGSWVDFLNSINWVVENRYIVIFNEPNHAKEWGGEINPEEYGWFLKEFSRRLQEKSAAFFILPAGLDASAPNTNETLDELQFIRRMVAKEPDVFQFIDGWSSHSYPNPNYSGSPDAFGRGTVRTFLWEKNVLSLYGAGHLPIFILETGWQHNDGKTKTQNLLNPQQVAEYYERSFTDAWNDNNVVAVVPFLLNYQDSPFDHFSWKKISSNEFYPMFDRVQLMSKTTALPRQRHSARFITEGLPQKLVRNSNYDIYVELENTGQSIISGESGWQLEISGLPADFRVTNEPLGRAAPFQRLRAVLHVTTPSLVRSFDYTMKLKKDEITILAQDNSLGTIPPPSLLIKAKRWFQKEVTGDKYSLLIYDSRDRVLHEFKNLEFSRGYTEVRDLYNVIPQLTYRLVLIKQYYLPRQVMTTFLEDRTTVTFAQLLPFDPSGDGSLNLNDVKSFFRHPIRSVGLLLGL